MRIRSAGNGEPGTNGGPAGDLYIAIRIKSMAHLSPIRRGIEALHLSDIGILARLLDYEGFGTPRGRTGQVPS